MSTSFGARSAWNRPLKKSPAATVRDAPPAPRITKLRAEREHHRAHVAGRIGVRDRPADRAHVTHLRVADLLRGVGHDRRRLLQQLAVRHVVVPRERADRDHVAVLTDVRQVADARDVDEQRGLREPRLHQRKQRVPARQDLRVVGPAEQLDRVVDRLRPRVLEGSRDHAAPPSRPCLASWIARHTRSGEAGLPTFVDAEVGDRVDHGVHDGRRGGDRAGFADALHAERVRGRGRRW